MGLIHSRSSKHRGKVKTERGDRHQARHERLKDGSAPVQPSVEDSLSSRESRHSK
jgi:hypothetical protein